MPADRWTAEARELSLESRACHRCRGRQIVSVKHGQIFETDSADEVALAYRDEECPECIERQRTSLSSAHASGLAEGRREAGKQLQERVAEWVRTRIGPEHMQSRERAMRLLEESVELAQAEGITITQVRDQVEHVYNRPAGEPAQEAAGVAICLLGWCGATSNAFSDLAEREIDRIERKPIDQIRGSLARKYDADLVTVVGLAETEKADAKNNA